MAMLNEDSTNQDILDYYDQDLDVTIDQIARMTFRTPLEIKQLLLGEAS
tara:strand:+ start:1100 stop:1246 length:147 start_codon:yes stop_codon:yes gene_type:complete